METNEQIRQALSKALAEELESFLEQVSQMMEGELKHLEEQVVKSSQAIGRKLMEGVLTSRLHERRPMARREGRCGHVQRLVGERPKELITLVGPVSCVRAYYHCLHGGEAEAKHDCTHGEAPADALWGVDKRRTTPGVQGHITGVSAQRSPCTLCKQVVDGANLAAEHFAGAVQILDLSHAKEHVWDVAHAVFGRGTAAGRAWATHACSLLEEGQSEALVSAISALPPIPPEPGQARSIPERAVDYFTTNAGRMRYPLFRAQGMHIGSGIAEAACKTIVSTRAKRSGMRLPS